MRTMLMSLVAAALVCGVASQADAQWVRTYYAPAWGAPQPVVVAPQQVWVSPQPMVVQRPVVVQPAPVVVGPQPVTVFRQPAVVVQPSPVVTIRNRPILGGTVVRGPGYRRVVW